MKEQNFKNHAMFSPLYHYITVPLSFLSIYLTVTYITRGINIVSVTLLLMAVLFILCITLIRYFPLRAQDRAIRAEENLRYFSMTGKLLDSSLKMSQITALRFASDPEFVALVEKASKENMSSKEIKLAIKNWRADNNRL